MNTFVPSAGLPSAPYIFVGEQPGKHEVRRREPFVGPAGQNLQECCRSARILWSETYRTNVIKDLDFPLEHYIKFTTGRESHGVFTKEGEEYLELLKEELLLTRGNIIIACGNVALWALCSRVGITHWRGSVLESTLVPGRKVIPTIHPATWTQEKLWLNPGAYLNKFLVSHDLKRARLESMYPEIRSEPRRLIIEPSYYDAISYIKKINSAGLEGAIIDYDIEIMPKNQELSCVGVGASPNEAMCIPFIGPQGNYFTVDQEIEIMELLAQLFSDPRITKRGQNIIFDSHYLLKKYGIRGKSFTLHDTMVAQGILYPEFRKSLEFITSMWTDMPYYKADGKLWLGGTGTWRKAWEYNCLDVLSCSAAHPKQMEELELKGNLSTYENQVRLIPALTYMMEHGIKIDLEGMKLEAINTEREIDAIKEQTYQVIGKEINLASPKQLQEYFYLEKGLAPYINSKTKRPTVDEEALVRISNQGHQEASLILQIRKLEKRLSTYLDLTQVDEDGRIRCSYNPVGTKFGRISSSANIFGTGTNLQNVPHDVLKFFCADEGYVIYSLDMSQIENRIVAYVGNILPMIEAFETGRDVHRLTAALVCNFMGIERTYETITPDERQDYGKRPNHAFNYGYGYKSFSLRYELAERIAKRIHTAYHSAYPGLRNGYWRYVQDELNTTRTLENLLGRRIPFFGQWGDKLLHEAYSAIPQSTCGDLVNTKGINFTYYNEEPEFRHVELLTQIHDSIEIQMPLSVPIAQHVYVLQEIKRSLEAPLHYRNHTFSIPVDLVVNTNMCKEEGVELKGDKFSSDPTKLRDNLLGAFTKLYVQYPRELVAESRS